MQLVIAIGSTCHCERFNLSLRLVQPVIASGATRHCDWFNLSLRAERSNLVTEGLLVRVAGSPRRFAPRDDKLGTRKRDGTHAYPLSSLVIARMPSGIHSNLVEVATAERDRRCYADEIATLRSQ